MTKAELIVKVRDQHALVSRFLLQSREGTSDAAFFGGQASAYHLVLCWLASLPTFTPLGADEDIRYGDTPTLNTGTLRKEPV